MWHRKNQRGRGLRDGQEATNLPERGADDFVKRHRVLPNSRDFLWITYLPHLLGRRCWRSEYFILCIYPVAKPTHRVSPSFFVKLALPCPMGIKIIKK